MKTPPPAELERIFNAAADGVIDDADEQALAAWLKRDPAARQHYREFMILHASLHWDYIQSALPAAGGDRVHALPETATQRSHAWWRWPLAAAAIFLAVIAGWQWLATRDRRPAGATAQQSVALLRGAIGAEWQDGIWQPGQSLAPGWLRLKAGAVQLEFSRGARVLLEGPAEFELLSDNAGFLRRGRLRATVPEAAHGFMIRGEGFSAVDRGTEFGCVVPESGPSELHVFAGRVDVAAGDGAPRILAKNEAVQIDSGRLEAIPARAASFMSDDTFARMEKDNASARLAAWREASAALGAHPAALIHYDFEQARGAGRTLPNRARGADVPASIIGCEPAQGRWPGKGALEWKRADDRLRFTVPGEMQSLTLMAWVRVDALPNTQCSLLMGEAELPGEVHWYVNEHGALGFAFIGADSRWHSLHSAPLLRAERLGTWVFVAVTFDHATATATHYLDGQPVATSQLDSLVPLHLRTVEIGNWGVRPGMPLRASAQHAAEPGNYVRNLNGRMDEFALLSTALSAAEIQRLYQQGRPTPDNPSSAIR
jgi:anti-sigma factor RsiW